MATESAEVIDGEIVPETPDAIAPAASLGTAVARRERRSEVIRPLNPDELVESFHTYQELLPRILDGSDYQAAEAGKRFVKKSGWRKIATAFDLDVELVAEVVERTPEGRILRSKTTARATSPSGRVMDGDGYCSVDEFTGRRANNPKLENDLRGTAATRAKNRAISDLVGMGEVSAEEVDGSGHNQEPTPAAEASDELKALVANVIAYLLEQDAAAITRAADALAKQYDGHLPVSAGQAIVIVGTAVKGVRDKQGAAS